MMSSPTGFFGVSFTALGAGAGREPAVSGLFLASGGRESAGPAPESPGDGSGTPPEGGVEGAPCCP
jgi:hypothetical protein